jgi:DNA polymerase III epsilon subunit-like protein
MIVIDIETTGIDPAKHGIISIGAVNFDDPNEWFYGEGRPSASVEITDGALDVNGFKREELSELPDPIVVTLSNFFRWCAVQESTPLIIGGHNPGFDKSFIFAESERCGLRKSLNPFGYHTIDLHTVAHADYLRKQGHWYAKIMPAYHIYRQLGIPDEPKPHYALNGAVWEAEAFSRILHGKSLFVEEFEQFPVKENPWR